MKLLIDDANIEKIKRIYEYYAIDGVTTNPSILAKNGKNPYETLKEICDAVNIPVVAIGGIGIDNISKLEKSGISGVAVISAIFAKDDIESATKSLKEQTKKVVLKLLLLSF